MDCGEQDEVSMSETISELSQYSEWQDSQESPGRKRKAALNDFLAAVDISPIHQKGKADHAYCVRNSGT